MTDRRRNCLILLLVVGLLVASLLVIAAKPTRLGLDLQGRRRARLRGRADPQAGRDAGGARARARHHARARRPARRRRAGDPAFRQRPDLRRPARRAEHQTRPAAGRHARPALLLRLGGKRPRAGRQNGRAAAAGAGPGRPADQPGAGDPGQGQTLYDAAKLAAEQEPITSDRNGSRFGSAYYLFDRDQRHLAGPERSRGDLLSAIDRRSLPPDSEVVTVPQGYVVLQAVAFEANARVSLDDPTARFYVLRDRIALSGKDIKDPQQGFDPACATARTSSSDSPTTASRRSTTSRARSPSAAPSCGCPGVDPRAVLQHFAVALDGRLISVASIDPQAAPGRHRRRERRGDRGRLHDPERAGSREPAAARRAADRAQADLAVAGVGDARQTGARRGPARGRGRLRDRRAVPDRLLPRARPDRGRRAG